MLVELVAAPHSTGFEHQHILSAGRELRRDDTARRARANHTDVAFDLRVSSHSPNRDVGGSRLRIELRLISDRAQHRIGFRSAVGGIGVEHRQAAHALVRRAELGDGAPRQTLEYSLPLSQSQQCEPGGAPRHARHEQRVPEQAQEESQRFTLGRLDHLQRCRDPCTYSEVGGRHAEECRIFIPLEGERRDEGVAEGVERFGLPVGEVHFPPSR